MAFKNKANSLFVKSPLDSKVSFDLAVIVM